MRSLLRETFDAVWNAWLSFLARPLRYQWAGALILAVIPASFLIGKLGWLTFLVIMELLCVACIVSLKTPHCRRLPAQENSVEWLVATIDIYCAQFGSRRLQRPWLLASLAAYISAFLLFVFTLSTDQPAWAQAVVSTAIGVVCMSVAGYFAEENPPKEGARHVLRIVKQFEALCRSEHEVLMSKIYRGAWQMEDLVAFAAAELKESKRQAALKEQNEVFRQPG